MPIDESDKVQVGDNGNVPSLISIQKEFLVNTLKLNIDHRLNLENEEKPLNDDETLDDASFSLAAFNSSSCFMFSANFL